MSRSSEVLAVAERLSAALRGMRFRAPVTHVYNPLEYARSPFARYVDLYGKAPREVLFLGMNPGPFGMAQTGVPFGDVASVRDFLRVEGAVGKPEREHPARPVLGFGCPRSEVSGARLWGFIAEKFGTPARFFAKHFVWNYCPLLFLEESGKNRTPDKLPAAEREPLEAACDRALGEIVEALGVKLVVGVGAFAEERATEVLGERVRVGRVLHPSPASPLANGNWAGRAAQELRELGLEV